MRSPLAETLGSPPDPVKAEELNSALALDSSSTRNQQIILPERLSKDWDAVFPRLRGV
jgi:hypothetical protein